MLVFCNAAGVLFIVQLISISRVSADVFTAMAGMESLVPTVFHVAHHLNEHIKAEESKLERLRWSLSIYLNLL